MKRIAHRGLSKEYPENTLLSFQKALEAGADGVETDLRLSLDEEVILFHDANLKRITGYDNIPEALSLAQLKKLDAGEGEAIPSLDELLQLTQGKATLILEIKYNPSTCKRLCEITIKLIENKLDWVEVSCFEDKALKYMHKLNPHVKLHKLIDKASTLKDKDFEMLYAYVSYFDVDVKLRNIVLDQGILQRHQVIFWTVENEDLSKEKEAGL
ncbi:hypothetical protein TSL6_08940 [Sulfurovum sp. TSL6]|uniref:glycerophosphodiester phosphodiesterase n=1 Tax=Sulfurovum sp. TSL6 TaxID=2826995 RepID=UPI001CC7C8AB|nr:glycerophosphodiester phosphodiesterase family protein [Sulfurovum sp. TSL6]GIU00388.1 hypothetical protein TSL6_08940 [Sulfurovum sp. TSL6]